MSVVVERVTELFETTCQKQFESLHCDIRLLENLECNYLENPISAVIKCYSKDIEITLLISAAADFLVGTIPMIGGSRLESVAFQQDWCLELSNRFLGRLKNKLLSHGCVLKMGLPELVDCHSQRHELGEQNSVVSLFQADSLGESGKIQCILSTVLLNPEVVLVDYEDEDEDWFDESELQHL